MVNEQTLSFLFSVKPEEVNKNFIYDLFSKTTETLENGDIVIKDPMFFPYEEITVKKGQLVNVFEDTQTTVGRYIYNLVMIVPAFGDIIPFVNKTLNGSEIDNFDLELSRLLIGQKITGEQFGKYKDRTVWFNNFSEILMPGQSLNLIVLPTPIRKELIRLINENREAIKNDDYITYLKNVEEPIVKFAENWYKENKDPGWPLYGVRGSPKFGNNFKNMFLEVGPIFDVAKGHFRISPTSFSEGIPPEEFALFSNAAISGAYDRAVGTAYSGAKTKEFSAAFQSLIIDGEDCGTDRTINIKVEENNINDILWCYVKGSDGDWVLITPENVNKIIGKTVKSRTPLYCKGDNICQKCAGELYRRLGIKNAGLTLMKLTSCFLNAKLKNMHDATVKLITINPKDYIYEFVEE